MRPRALLSAFALAIVPSAPVLSTSPTESAVEKIDTRAPDYVRCRKLSVTGSLVKKERICKTNAEWAKASETTQNDANDLVTRNRGLYNPE